MGRNVHGILRGVLAITGILAVTLLFRSTASQVAQVVLLAAVIAFLLKPLCARLERRMPRGVSALLSILGVLMIFAALVYLAVPPLILQLSAVGDALSAFAEYFQSVYASLAQWAEKYGVVLPSLSGLLSNTDGFFSDTITLAGNLAGNMYKLVLSGTLACFFLIDRERLLLRLELFIPSKCRKRAVRMGNAVRREMYLYVRGQAMISLVVGVLSAAGLMLVKVPSALVLGLLVGILNLIPYFGPILGSIPAVIMALQGGLRQAILAAVVLAVVQQLDGMIISPRIMGGLTGLSPASVLLAVFAGSTLSGIGGMLIALPFLMAIRTLFRVYVQKDENI